MLAPKNFGARATAAALLAVCLTACTSVGIHTKEMSLVDFGSPATINVCVLRTEDVSEAKVVHLLSALNREFAAYGIEIAVPWQRTWERPGFTHNSLFTDVISRDLEPGCDRLLGFVDRHLGDFVWGLALPEILGEVDDVTHTRGFVVANAVSLTQAFTTPAAVTIHEFYHMLGCPHSASMTGCYAQIRRLKAGLRPGASFFPGMMADGALLLNRQTANNLLREARGEVRLSQTDPVTRGDGS